MHMLQLQPLFPFALTLTGTTAKPIVGAPAPVEPHSPSDTPTKLFCARTLGSLEAVPLVEGLDWCSGRSGCSLFG